MNTLLSTIITRLALIKAYPGTDYATIQLALVEREVLLYNKLKATQVAEETQLIAA